MARNIGTVFVELQLDDKVYKQKLSEVQTGAVATAKGVETAWKALGTKSSEYFDLQRKSAQNAYTLIKESATAATADITRAHEAMTRRIEQLNQQQAGVHQATNKSLTEQAASWGLVASKAYLAYQAVHLITGVFVAGFKAVEDYQTSVASLAATMATFSEQGKTDMAGAYREAYKYSSLLVEKIEEWDAKTILTGKQLTSMVETLIQGGVQIDVNNKKHEEGIIAIANAIAVMTKGQNVEIQLRQEIRGLLDGEAKATNRLAQILEQAVGGSLKDHVEKWKMEGTLIENAGKLLAGFSEGAKDLENTWGAISSTIETIANKVLRDVFRPVYEDIVRLAKEYTLEVMKGNDGLNTAKTALEEGIYKTWLSIKTIVDGIYRVIWPLIEAEKLVLGIAGKILDQLGNVVTIFGVLAKRLGAAFKGEFGKAFASGLIDEFKMGMEIYARDLRSQDWFDQMGLGGKGGTPPKLSKPKASEESVKKAAAEAEARRKALEELNVMVGKTEGELQGKLAAIEKRYEDMRVKLKGNAEALVVLEQWKKDAIAKLYDEQDKETEKYFEDAVQNTERGMREIERAINEGLRTFEQKREMLGMFTEIEQAAMATAQAIEQMMIDINDGFLASKNSIKEFDDTFAGMAQGFKDGINIMIEETKSFHQIGLEAWETFNDAVKDMIGDQVDAFIRGEETKKSLQEAAGDIMASVSGKIAKEMYAKAIESIVGMIGAYIGEGAAASGASGALGGGFPGAMAQIGLYLGTAVAAMLAGKGMASAFKAEGGWVGSHPNGGWLTGGSGYRDDIYLGMTPGVRHWGMGGEFVVNKSSAQKHAGLLRAINSDKGHDSGGPIDGSWEPLADMLVAGTLASAAAGFMKGLLPGAIAEAIAFNVGAIGGSFGGKALGSLFAGHADGGFLDRGYFLGGLGDWINPFNNPITRGIGLPSPGDLGLPDPGEALADLLDPERLLEALKEELRAPYRQVAKDIITPGKMWSSPIDLVTDHIKALGNTFKRSIGWKHGGGVFMPGEQLAVVQTGEGVVSHRGMDMLAKINRGWAEGGEMTPEDIEAQRLALMKTFYGTSPWTSQNAVNMDRAETLAGIHESNRWIQENIWGMELSNKREEMIIALRKLAGDTYGAKQADRARELAAMDPKLRFWQEQINKQEDYNEVRKKEIELLEAQGKTQEALTRKREEELRGMSPAVQAIQKQIWAAEDAKKAEEELAKVRENAAAEAEKQRQAAISALNKQVSSLKTGGFSTKAGYLRAFYTLTNQMVALGGGSDIPVPGFASGGYHSGGWRVVGERGPELEYTGPSRIFSGAPMGDSGGVREELGEIRQLLWAIEGTNRQTARTLDKFDNDGMPTARDSETLTTWGN